MAMEKLQRDVASPELLSVHLNFLGLLGKGTFGSVFLAEDESKAKVAVKVMRKKDKLMQCQWEALAMEWRCLKCNSGCAYVPQGYFAFQTANHVCLVMDYVECTIFADYLRQFSKRLLPEKFTKTIAAQLAMALDFLHQNNLIHRDVKEDNVLVSHKLRVKLIDFGLASESTDTNRLRDVCGASRYMSFECHNALTQPVGKATDFWSLGVMLYKVLHATYPYNMGENMEELEQNMMSISYSSELSDAAADFLYNLLVVDPAKRMHTIEKVREHGWFDPWLQTLNYQPNLPLRLGRVHRKDPSNEIFNPIMTQSDPCYFTHTDVFPHVTLNEAMVEDVSPIACVRLSKIRSYSGAPLHSHSKPRVHLHTGVKMKVPGKSHFILIQSKWMRGTYSNIYSASIGEDDKLIMKVFFKKHDRAKVVGEYRILLALRNSQFFASVRQGFDLDGNLCLLFNAFTSKRTLKHAIDAGSFVKQKTIEIIVRTIDYEKRETLKSIHEGHWRFVLYQLVGAVFELQKRRISHNNLNCSQVLYDMTQKTVQITGFSEAVFLPDGIHNAADQRAVANMALFMFVLEENLQDPSLPEYLSDDLCSVMMFLRQSNTISFEDITSLRFFAESAPFTDLSQESIDQQAINQSKKADLERAHLL